MAVDIAEKKATLEVTYAYGEDTKFDFILPISVDYEVEFSIYEKFSRGEEYDKHSGATMNMKYSQGMLLVHIECEDKQEFILSVRDTEHFYRADGSGSWDERDEVDTMNIEVTIAQDEHYNGLY